MKTGLFAALVAVVMVAVLTAFAPMALAQDDAKDEVVYKKRTIIDLSGAVIEGELTKPEGSYIVNRKLSRFSKLIQERGDYNFELLGSANDL